MTRWLRSKIRFTSIRITIFIFCFFLTSNILSQNDSIYDGPDYEDYNPELATWSSSWSDHNTVDENLGYSFFNFHDLYNYIGTKTDPNYPIILFGVSAKTIASGDLGFLGIWSDKDAQLSYNYMPGQKLYVSDTLKYTLSGYNIQLNWGKDIFYKNDVFDLLFFYGYSFGRLKLLQIDKGVEKKYTNPAIMFNFGIEPRLNFYAENGYGFSFGIKGGYLWDITNPDWKRKSSNLPKIPWTKMSSTYLQVTVGFNY